MRRFSTALLPQTCAPPYPRWRAALCLQQGNQMTTGNLGGELLERALAGQRAALVELIQGLTPVVQARVARAQWTSGRSADAQRHEREDLVQEAFAKLFARGAQVLRSWSPERGMSLTNFVGLVAYRHTLSILCKAEHRNALQNIAGDFESILAGQAHTEEAVASRELLELVVERLERKLSPLGYQVFRMLLVEDRSTREIAEETGLTPAAIYTWRHRLVAAARTILADTELDPAGPNGIPKQDSPRHGR